MRKFIFSGAMVGVLVGGWNVLQSTRSGPRDWRLAVMWVGWLLSATVAIGTILEDADDRRIDD